MKENEWQELSARLIKKPRTILVQIDEEGLLVKKRSTKEKGGVRTIRIKKVKK